MSKPRENHHDATAKKKPLRPSSTYRWARRTDAKKKKLIWSQLQRVYWNGGIYVIVPE